METSPLERLTPLVYEELHRAAKLYISREQGEHTLQTTEFINELYLRMIRLRQVNWQNRAHFFAACARLMRRILTDLLDMLSLAGEEATRGTRSHMGGEISPCDEMASVIVVTGPRRLQR